MNGQAPQHNGGGRRIAKIALAVMIFLVACLVIDAIYILARVKLGRPDHSLTELLPVIDRNEDEGEQEAATAHPEIDLNAPVVLPGLAPDEINKTLEASGFDCGATEQGVSGYFQGLCTRQESQGSIEVYHFGRNEADVDLIDINLTVAQPPNDEQVLKWLDEVLNGIGAPGAAPALTWAGETLPGITEERVIREAEFGGAKYRLYGAPANRSLELGWLP